MPAKPTPAPTKRLPSATLKHHKTGLRRPKDSERVKYADLLTTYKLHLKELLPHSTACDLMGVDSIKYQEWILRYPAIRDECKMARAEGIRDAHREVAAGAQGWQAKMRLLESLDPENWLRSTGSGRKANDASPYSQAMRRK